jgi:acyl carrier protein
MMTDTLRLVTSIIREKVEVDENEIKLESRLVDDLGFDSLGLVELVLTFEETFNVEISDKETEQFRTVQDIVHYVEGLGAVAKRPRDSPHPT